jgi:transposase-like protein DUF772
MDVTLRDKVTPNGINSLAVSATYILSVRIRYAVYRRRFRTPDDVFTFYRVLSLVRSRLRVDKPGRPSRYNVPDVMRGPRFTSTGPVQEPPPPRLLRFPVGPAVVWASAEPVRWVQGAFKISAPRFRPPIKMMRYRWLSIWIYSYARGVSSARQISREMEHEPGLQWLAGMEVVNHHTLSDFRVAHGSALQHLMEQVLGVVF